MSIQAICSVLKYSKTKGQARLFLIILANYIGPNGEAAFPKVKTLANDMGGVTERQIRRLSQIAESLGELERVINGHACETNLYRLLLPGIEPESEGQDSGDPRTKRSAPPGPEGPPTPGLKGPPLIRKNHDKEIRKGNRAAASAAGPPSPPAPAKPEKKPRPRNPIFDAIAATCYPAGVARAEAEAVPLGSVLTKSEIGRIVTATGELAAIGADPATIEGFAAWWRRKYRDATLTPQAIAGNWSDYRAASTASAPRKPIAPPLALPVQPRASNAPEEASGKPARERITILNPNIAKHLGAGRGQA